MEEHYDIDTALMEHRFWLQIMGDHARFIFFSLTPNEVEYIQRSQDFIISYDQLLEQSQRQLTLKELDVLNRQAYQLTQQFREFLLLLLALTLGSGIKVHLSSTFFNDMLNELEEYMVVLNALMNNTPILFHPIHYHLLWLPDAIGHAASVAANLDLIERDLIDKSNYFVMNFSDLSLKATIMNGYLRTKLPNFPALARLNDQADQMIQQFKEFLEYLRDHRSDGRVLGTLFPLMADHMAREECYYLWKLTLTAGLLKRPDCDPTRQRLET